MGADRSMLAAAVVACLAVAGCGGGEASDEVSRDDGGSAIAWHRPGVGATWQWQLDGELDTSIDADVYDVDLFETSSRQIEALHADGRYVICYFSAGSVEEWRDDADRFDPDDVGDPLADWDGERWLDIRSDAVFEVMLGRLDRAAGTGCDGVEPDNVQAYVAVTGFDLSVADQLAYDTALADAAHERGLAIGLKNAAELVPELVASFDFSVVEQCFEYDECESYTPFVAAGKPVFAAEYRTDDVADATSRGELCAHARALDIRTVVLPLELDGSFRHSCDG